MLLEKIYRKENPPDMLTKVVPEAKFNHFRNLLHVLSIA